MQALIPLLLSLFGGYAGGKLGGIAGPMLAKMLGRFGGSGAALGATAAKAAPGVGRFAGSMGGFMAPDLISQSLDNQQRDRNARTDDVPYNGPGQLANLTGGKMDEAGLRQALASMGIDYDELLTAQGAGVY